MPKCQLVHRLDAKAGTGDRGRSVVVLKSGGDKASTTATETATTAAAAVSDCQESEVCAVEGQLLLTSPAFAKVLAVERWPTHCATCFQTPSDDLCDRPKPLSRCGRCRVAQYCSRECQKSDWQAHHHVECAVLPRLLQLTRQLSNEQIAEVLLLARVVRTSRNKQQQQEQDDETRREHEAKTQGKSVLDLVLEQVTPQDLAFHAQDLTPESQLMAALTKKLGLVDDAPSLQQLSELLCRFQCNNFSITNDLMEPIGAGCFPMGAMVNHSCDPNSVVRFEPKTCAMQFRAIRSIRHGEQLTQTYVDVALPRSRRKTLLQSQYHFDCQCSRCTASPTDSSSVDFQLEVDVNGKLPSEWSPSRHQSIQMARQRVTCIDLSTDQRALDSALSTFRHELGDLNFELFEVVSKKFSSQMDASQFADAMTWGLHMLRFYDLVYGNNHPMKALHLFTLGDLWAHLTSTATTNGHGHQALQERQAPRFFAEAHRILSLCHGQQATLVRQLEQRLLSWT